MLASECAERAARGFKSEKARAAREATQIKQETKAKQVPTSNLWGQGREASFYQSFPSLEGQVAKQRTIL